MQAAGELISRFKVFVIDPLILVVFAAGFLVFIYGLVQFIWDLDEGGHRSEGIEHMKWGILGMLVMSSVYGIITILDNTFGLGVFTGPDMTRFPDVNLPTNLFN